MVNVYGLELEARMRRQSAERRAAADRLGRPDRGPRRPAQTGMKWQAGELLLRLGRWMQDEAGPSSSDLAWR